MLIRFECPCGKAIKTSPGNAGRRVRCPKCLRPCLVPPAPGGSSPAAAPDPADTYLDAPSAGRPPSVVMGAAIFLGILAVAGGAVLAFAIPAMRQQQREAEAGRRKGADPSPEASAPPLVRAGGERAPGLSSRVNWVPELEGVPEDAPAEGKRGGKGRKAPRREEEDDPKAAPPKQKGPAAKSTQGATAGKADPEEIDPEEAVDELVAKGRAAVAEGDFVKARDAFAEAEKACKGKAKEARVRRAEVCFRLAYVYNNLDPAQAAVYLQRGKALLLAAKTERAEINFRFVKVRDDMRSLGEKPKK